MSAKITATGQSRGPKAPTFKHDVTFCGAITEGGKPCRRLVAHRPEPRLTNGQNLKGDDALGHNAFAPGNGVRRPKVVKPKAVKAPKVVQPKAASLATPVLDGSAAFGSVVIGGVTYVLVPQVTEPTKSARKTTVKAAPKGKVKVLPVAGPEGRDVQTLKRAKNGRFVTSGRPSARLA